MTNSDEKKTEIAPGIFFVYRRGRYSLALETPESGEIMCWDYDEVAKDPISWFSTLKAVSIATQKGPSIAYDWIKSRLAQYDTPAGTMFCNVCSAKFIAGDNHPYIFAANLNNKKYYDLQCSLECNKRRKIHVYATEFGEDFIKLWNDRFLKQRENTQA